MGKTYYSKSLLVALAALAASPSAVAQKPQGAPKAQLSQKLTPEPEAETGRGVPSKEPHSGNDKVSWCEEDHTAAGTQTWIAGADKEQVAANQNAATCSVGHEDLG